MRTFSNIRCHIGDYILHGSSAFFSLLLTILPYDLIFCIVYESHFPCYDASEVSAVAFLLKVGFLIDYIFLNATHCLDV